MTAFRPAQAVDPDAARERAQHILSGRRYSQNPTPRPLRGPLQWLGDRLRGIVDWFSRIFDHVSGWVWLFLGIAIVAALITWIVIVFSRRAATMQGAYARGASRADDDGEDPDVLERGADEAERDGDLERAVRLRFRAGLLRLGRRGAIAYRPSVTTSEVRRALGSDTFDDLAETFEGIAYGGQAAQPPDVDTAKRAWPRVVEEAAHR